MHGLFDVHCHLIPYVDDGARNMEEAVRMLKMEYSQGVRYIIVTPHYRRGMFETPMEKVLSYFLKLREEERRLEFSCFWGVSIMWNGYAPQAERKRTSLHGQLPLCARGVRIRYGSSFSMQESLGVASGRRVSADCRPRGALSAGL